MSANANRKYPRSPRALNPESLRDIDSIIGDNIKTFGANRVEQFHINSKLADGLPGEIIYANPNDDPIVKKIRQIDRRQKMEWQPYNE